MLSASGLPSGWIKYAESFGRNAQPADIIALQEIGTRAAAERLFPPTQYHVVMSSRYTDVARPEGEGDIFTAVAFRKNRGISLIRQEDIGGLSVRHADGHPVRAAATVLLDVNGKQLWFASIHLKSSCASTKRIDTSKNDDCQTLWAQSTPLLNWIKAQKASNIPFILAGDFNRQFKRFKNEGPLWKKLSGGDSNSPWLDQHPASTTRRCPTRKGKSTQPIDWILVESTIKDWVVKNSFWERRFTYTDIAATSSGKGDELSDHCPISLELEIP